MNLEYFKLGWMWLLVTFSRQQKRIIKMIYWVVKPDMKIKTENRHKVPIAGFFLDEVETVRIGL